MSPTLFMPLVLLSGHLTATAPVPCNTCRAQGGSVASQTAGAVSGVVRDADGGVIPGASVVVRAASGREVRGVSGPDGRFSVVWPNGAAEVIVRANGFAEGRQSIAAEGARPDLTFVLAPAAVSASVTVTATSTEQQLGDVPASVSVLGREEIRRSPAVVADDLLRRVPTFSLFRRTSSIASHPTAQGVSLRGIGPSGVSRTLVLLDGVPFNDPFGGWVYWSRLPMESADRIEVVDGASSSLYGNYAMGGVINVIATPATPRSVDVKAQYGSRSTPKFDVRASDVWGKLGASVDASYFDTDGYEPVVESEQGAVDSVANVKFRNVNVKLDYAASDSVTGFLRVGSFHEERNNGKFATVAADFGNQEANETSWTSVNGGVRLRSGYGDVQATVFVDDEEFKSNFMAVPAATPARSIGRMTLNQTVPTKGFGTIVQWSHAIHPQHYLTAGVDWRRVDGDSEEDALDAQVGRDVTLRRVSGGTQQLLGFFVQDLFSPVDRLTVTLGARIDRWRNYDGHNLETNANGTLAPGNVPSLPDRDDTAVSPRVAARYRVADRVSVWGGVSRGFRAPTLNELYRQFRVGQVLTLANSDLGPERLTGAEGGVTVSPARNMLVRATTFFNRIKDPISNVFQSQTGQAVTNKRENLGRTRVRGLQLDAEYQLMSYWKISGGYLFNDAKVTENVKNQDLVGKFLPQVPRHRGSVEVAYANPRYVNVSIAVLAYGRQFDDDLNSRVVPGYAYPGLPKYATVDFSAFRQVGPNFEVFLGVQNMLDQIYYVGTLPTLVGSPRSVTGGLRISLRGR